MVECLTLFLRVGIHEHVLVAAFYPPAVMELVRLLDPGRRLGHVDGERLILVAESQRAVVVGSRDLGAGGEGEQTGAGGEQEAVLHARDSSVGR
jgi:hypothetical protein